MRLRASMYTSYVHTYASPDSIRKTCQMKAFLCLACPSQTVADGAVFYSSDRASHFEGTAAAFTCSAGFQAQGTQTIVCQPDGQWSGTLGTCEPLVTENTSQSSQSSACPTLNIANGVVSYSPNAASLFEGTVATYTCSAGFLAQGTQSIVCQLNGQWSGTLGTCEIRSFFILYCVKGAPKSSFTFFNALMS
jgi:hypothetical protein